MNITHDNKTGYLYIKGGLKDAIRSNPFRKRTNELLKIKGFDIKIRSNHINEYKEKGLAYTIGKGDTKRSYFHPVLFINYLYVNPKKINEFIFILENNLIDLGLSLVFRYENLHKFTNVIEGVYVMLFFNDKESFYKIGISSNVKNRHNTFKRLDYNVKIIHVLQTEHVGQIETELHNKYRHKSHVPLTEFDGWTECFDLDVQDIEELRKLYKRDSMNSLI